MSSISVTCPQQIAIENHQKVTSRYWADPVYKQIAADRIRGETCHFCETSRATMAHHDNAGSYRTQEEYYKPENMTPCCQRCHHEYRRGRVICPVCHQHYIPPGEEKCRWCRGIKNPGRPFKLNYKIRQKHPCGHRVGKQRCQRDGRLFVCGRSSRNARGCDHFLEREARS
jgi:hypothetical protein